MVEIGFVGILSIAVTSKEIGALLMALELSERFRLRPDLPPHVPLKVEYRGLRSSGLSAAAVPPASGLA